MRIPSLVLTTVLLIASGCGGAAATPASPPPPPDTSIKIKTASLTVDGKPLTALTNGAGMTLYVESTDFSNLVACTGNCASVWPPLLAVLGDPVADKGVALSGKLSTVLGGDGRQVEYNGHPLYTYSKDTGPGQTNGQGVAGRWGVATADMAVVGPAPSPAPTAAPAPTPSPTK